MKSSRTTQPYRAGQGVRAQTSVLLNMMRGSTATGYNPQDAARGLAKMAHRAGGRRRDRRLPPRRRLPPSPR